MGDQPKAQLPEHIYYTCSFCNRGAQARRYTGTMEIPAIGGRERVHNILRGVIIATQCPHPSCHEFAVQASLHRASYREIAGNRQYGPSIQIGSWTLQPRSEAKPMPSYVPQAIRQDYQEACLIRDLSPKASATLARRCLQGMIRDFHGVKKGRLKDEIDAIKDKVDPETWNSIDSLREIGNIGAHMEKDINVIVDVEPEEAHLLITLIEALVKDWYVNREERRQLHQNISETAKRKSDAQAQGKNKTTP